MMSSSMPGGADPRGIRRKPDTTFGSVKADAPADKESSFKRGSFCSVIRGSAWPA